MLLLNVLLVCCGMMLNVDWFSMCGHTKTVPVTTI